MWRKILSEILRLISQLISKILKLLEREPMPPTKPSVELPVSVNVTGAGHITLISQPVAITIGRFEEFAKTAIVDVDSGLTTIGLRVAVSDQVGTSEAGPVVVQANVPRGVRMEAPEGVERIDMPGNENVEFLPDQVSENGKNYFTTDVIYFQTLPDPVTGVRPPMGTKRFECSGGWPTTFDLPPVALFGGIEVELTE